MRKILMAVALVALSVLPAFAQTSSSLTPSYKSIRITGTGSTGDVSAMSVTASGSTQTLGQWFINLPASLGPAQGDILGAWPNLYFAPSPTFTGTPVISGAAASQLEFLRGGNLYTFIGSDGTQIGISSSENLPIEFANNGFQTRLYIDPAFGNIGIGTTNPGARLDVAAQSMILEQPYTPATSSTACTTGQISWDTGFVYICTATNAWKRAALSTWP